MVKRENEGRKFKRHDTEVKIYFDFAYDLETKVNFEFIDKKGKILPEKYEALSRNISVEGLCFLSNKKVVRGDFLHLEVYLPSAKDPIHMKGEVKWCRIFESSSDASLTEKKGNPIYHAGVKLLFVNGQPVHETIHYDKEYDVNWSIVMETVLGSYRIMMRERSKKKSG
jgi:hypothetical protein